MENEFLKFMADVMDVDVSEISLDTKYGELEDWDSMMHMRFVMELESEYGVDIPIDEIPEIDTFRKFYSYIEK